MNAACYARVSTTEQAEHGYSIQEQEERLKKYCAAVGWNIVNIYTDAGFSGATTNRPALKRMISDIKRGGIDRVVVFKLDRLSRSQKDTLRLIEDCFKKYNCDFVSISESFDTSSAFGMAMIGILSVFAQLERETIKERMSMGIDARAKSGLYIGRRSPCGYDTVEGVLVPNEYEKEIIKRIYDDFLSGESVNGIAEKLNASGLYKKSGGKWFDISISRMLDSKLYCGYIKHRKKWMKGNHEPIISEEKWLKVHQMREASKADFERRQIKPFKATSLLGGIIFCGVCGAKMTKYRVYSDRTHKKLKGFAYRCYNNQFQRIGSALYCPAHYVEDKVVDSAVADQIRLLKLEPEEVETPRGVPDRVDRINTLRKKTDEIEQQVERLVSLFAVGNMPVDVIQKKIESLTNQKRLLEKQIEAEENAPAAPTREEIKEAVNHFERIFSSNDLDAMHEAVLLLVDRVTVFEDRIEIHWRF